MNLDWLSAVLGFIGGTAAIGAAFVWSAKSLVGYFADHRLKKWQSELDLSLENARASLRREEYLYDYQMKAARQFMLIYNHLMPNRSHPDMDFTEALDAFAQTLHSIEPKLNKFMNEHQAVLPKEVCEKIWSVASRANEASYQTNYLSDAPDKQLADPHYDIVEEVWEELNEAHDVMRDLVWMKPGSGGG